MAGIVDQVTNVLTGQLARYQPELVEAGITPEMQQKKFEDARIGELQASIANRIAQLRSTAAGVTNGDAKEKLNAAIAQLESNMMSTDAHVLGLALMSAVITQMTANDVEAAEELDSIISSVYELTPEQTKRAKVLCRRIDINDPKSVRAFADALVDPTMPKDMQERHAKQLADAMVKDPAQVAIHNAATPAARLDAAAKWMKAQNDFKALEKDNFYQSIAETIKSADRMGLESIPHVQELLDKAKHHQIEPGVLKAELDKRIDLQRGKYIEEMTEARKSQSPERQAILDSIGDNKAVYLMARKVIEGGRFTDLSEQQRVALDTFALTRDKAVWRILGDNAFAASYDLERKTGTAQELEERTDRAMKAIKDHMTPELTAMAEKGEKYLRERVKQSLINADESKIPVSQMDQISGRVASDFSREVGEDTRAAIALAKNMTSLRAVEAQIANVSIPPGISTDGKTLANGAPPNGPTVVTAIQPDRNTPAVG